MKKIPGFYALFTAILMALSATSYAADSEEIVLLEYNATDGYYINMPANGTKTLNISSGVTSFSLYDDGGKDDDYSNSISGCLVFKAPDKKLLQVSGSSEFYDDHMSLTVYDGTTASRELYYSEVSEDPIGPFVSSRGVMTVCFGSLDDDPGYGYGLDLTMSVVDAYTIDILTVSGGSVEANYEYTLSGKTVTLTATPDAGYLFDGVSFDKAVTNVSQSGNAVSFEMPAGNVTVTPSFKKVTFDNNGCLADHVYFHLECGNSECSISQIITSSPGSNDYSCWYDATTGGLIDVVNGATNKYYAIKLASDLNLGGYDTDNNKCYLNFVPLDGEHYGLAGEGNTINDFCYINDAGEAGFFGYTYSGADYENVTFKNAYVKGDGNVGVVISKGGDSRFSNVTIDGATVSGEIAGGVAGYLEGMQQLEATVSDVIVKNTVVTATVAGGALAGSGYVYASGSSLIDNTISGTGYLGGAFGSLDGGSHCSGETISGTTVTGTSAADNVGGYVGAFWGGLDVMMSPTSGSIQQIAFNGTLSSAGNVGGMIGKLSLEEGASANILNTYSIGNISSTGSGSAGYIIGDLSATSGTTYQIINNYHFDDDGIELGIGNYSGNWAEGSSAVYANVRNAGTKLQSSGTMGLYIYSLSGNSSYQIDFFPASSYDNVSGPTNPIRNGIANDADMKSEKFAALLNKNIQVGSILWSQSDSENESLPNFTSAIKNHVVLVWWDNASCGNLSDKEINDYGFRTFYRYENSQIEKSFYMVGYTTQTNGLTHFSTGFADSVNAVISGEAGDARYVHLVDESGNVVVVDDKGRPFRGSGHDDMTFAATTAYDIVYEYCDGDPSYGTANCEDIDNITDKTFIFMTPRVDRLLLDASLENVVVPMIFVLGETYGLKYDIDYIDSHDASMTVGANAPPTSNTGYWLAPDVINANASGASEVKKIVLKFYLNSDEITDDSVYPWILVKNPNHVEFSVEMGGDVNGKSTHAKIADVSNINGNSVLDNVSVPFTRYLKVKEKTGYTLDSYSVSFNVIHDDCTDGSPKQLTPNVVTNNYFASVEDLYDATKLYCSISTWVIKDIDADSEIDLANALRLYTKLGYEMNTETSLNLSIEPVFTLINYTVSFDISSLKNNAVVLGNNWETTKAGMNVETNKEFSHVYVLQQAGASGNLDYVSVRWSSSDPQNSQSIYSSERLTTGVLENLNPPSSEFKVYPIVGRISVGVTTLKVAAYDEDGNALTDDKDYHGSVVLSQVVGADVDDLTQVSSLCDISVGAANSAYNHCLYLPKASDTLTFKVSLDPEDGYAMSLTGFSFDWQDPTGKSGAAGDPPAGFGYDEATGELVIAPAYMANHDMILGVKYAITGPFYVTYDLNTNADKKYLYFPVDAKESEKLEFSKAVHSVSLWQPYNANLMCFDGWSVTDPLVNTPQDKYKDLSEANAIQENLSMDPDAPTTLYANWSTCVDAPATKITIANGNTKATLNLKQTFDGVVYEHMLDDQNIVLAGGIYEFTIDDENSAVSFGYAKGDITASVEVANNDGSESTPEDITFSGNVVVMSTQNDNQQKPSQNTIYSLKMGTSIVPLRFVLDVNAPIDSVFYGMGFNEFEREFADDEALPNDIYRTEYKLSGWRFEKGKATATPVTMVYQAQTHEFFNDEMVQDYNMYYKAYGRYPDTLYAVWTAVNDPQMNLVINKSRDIASFKLSREIAGRKIEYLVSDTLKVPAERGFEFDVETIYDTREWIVDGKFPITLIDAAGDTIDTVEDFFMVNESMYLIANLKSANTSVRVALDENSKDSVFFGSDWTEELTSDNPDSAMVLPKIVYNAEKCLAGWTTDPESDELLTVIDKDLLSKLRAKGRSQGVDVRELLYAKWTTNLDSCAGAFMKLAVEQENGSVWFAEGDKDKTIERRFTEEGTMFVPMELNGRNFRVRAMGADTSVYVLDSLVVMRDGNVDTVLHVGDYMPEILDNVTLKAYFGWKNKTKLDFARARLDSTGSMFKLSFTASDFEVRRKVSAKVQVVDIVKDSIVTQSVFGDSIAMGFDTTFVFRMKKPGNYRMVVTLEDKTGVKENFSREISVDPVISSIAADSWQMLSLSAVDMSAVTWDGDQVFYWWDEYGTGEFWQYKQLTKNDSLDATRGVWYNSLEGRPLPLRDEIDDEGEDFVWELDKANSGWNMVANPHGWAVNLFANYPDAAKDIDENPDVLFWSWNTTTGQYDPMFEEIGPYEAVWVQVSKDTKWKVSAAPAFKGESKAVEKSRSLAKSKTKDRWTLQAKLLDKNGKQDSWNILGAGLNPLTTEEPPESMADHVNLSIVDGKRALAKSIKEASDEMEWTIALSASSDRIGYLSFDGIDGIKDFGFRVFVTVDGNTTEMQNGVPLKVYLKSTAKMATVRVAPADRVVAQNTLKGLRMARLGNQLRVSFEASEGLAGTNARIDILDMKGHVMSTVTAKTLDGSNALVLDAPQTGLYMLRVRAGSEQQAKKIVVK